MRCELSLLDLLAIAAVTPGKPPKLVGVAAPPRGLVRRDHRFVPGDGKSLVVVILGGVPLFGGRPLAGRSR